MSEYLSGVFFNINVITFFIGALFVIWTLILAVVYIVRWMEGGEDSEKMKRTLKVLKVSLKIVIVTTLIFMFIPKGVNNETVFRPIAGHSR